MPAHASRRQLFIVRPAMVRSFDISERRIAWHIDQAVRPGWRVYGRPYRSHKQEPRGHNHINMKEHLQSKSCRSKNHSRRRLVVGGRTAPWRKHRGLSKESHITALCSRLRLGRGGRREAFTTYNYK